MNLSSESYGTESHGPASPLDPVATSADAAAVSAECAASADHGVSGSVVSGIRVAFWNLQNLFDLNCSAIASELDYTPLNGWDRQALDARIHSLAEVITQMHDGHGPDLLGICEIESERIARRLIQESGRSDYRLAHADHPEIKGLDTSLIYSDKVFDENLQYVRGHMISHRFPTRDVFEVHLRVRSNDANLVVLVNHWPSRTAGRDVSESCRIAVASHCARLVDSCVKVSRREYLDLRDNEVSLFRLNQLWDRNILIMGDLNDEPWNRSVLEVLRAGNSVERLDESIRFVRGTLPSWKVYAERPVWLFNPMWSLAHRPDTGTVSCSDGTQSLMLRDQFIISRGLYFGHQGLQISQGTAGIPDVRILQPECMTSRRGRPKEFRRENCTGYSNHFPIATTINIIR